MARYIAGDWGTTHLRLHLCDEAGQTIETKNGPGAAGLVDPAGTYVDAIADWEAAHGRLASVLCGMVGSTIGWREVPYQPCPADPARMADACLILRENGRVIAIAPGLSCTNRLDAPDVMRGEETQILGALAIEPRLKTGRRLLCLPGTHTKWVALRDGAAQDFVTAPSGELFSVLCAHSILVNASGEASTGDAFARALQQACAHPAAELTHLLFQVRSRQLAGDLPRDQAASFLSGLVIGRDVAGAERIFRSEFAEAEEIVIVGAPSLAALYARALRPSGRSVRLIDGARASLAGLHALYRALFAKDALS